MRTAIASLTFVCASIFMAYTIVGWLDQSFISEYALAHNLNQERITLVETKDQCNGTFDTTYGVCIK